MPPGPVAVIVHEADPTFDTVSGMVALPLGTASVPDAVTLPEHA